MQGCNDESSFQSPSVEYGSQSIANDELANYRSADWLYQNYFGDYGLPEELKGMMLPELKLLANGFALQHSRGEDVQHSIAQLNKGMQMLHYSGQMDTSIQQMLSEYHAGVYDVPERDDSVEVHERYIDEEMQANLREADRLDQEFMHAQEQLVIDHNLPYPLPGRAAKYVVYSQTMKSSSGKSDDDDSSSSSNNGNSNNNAANDSPDSSSDTSSSGTSNNNGKQHSASINDWSWYNADIIWSNALAGIGHVGLVYNVNGDMKFVVDANTGAGVAKHEEGLHVWANEGGWSQVRGYWYSAWGKGDYHRNQVVNYALDRVGQSYNWVFWNKQTEDKTYCSQLVWQAFYSRTVQDGFEMKRVDLDSNGGKFVFPNDILNHYQVDNFAATAL